MIRHRVIAVLGKGGVGRTSMCLALARFAADRGRRTLIMETDPRIPIATALHSKSNFVPTQADSSLWLMLLDRQKSVEEYLGLVLPRAVLRAVFASALYQYFIHAAPGLRELMMMGKIYHESERRPRSEAQWDLILVDFPASGQALEMIGMPSQARRLFADTLVGREAESVANFFRDRGKCSFIVVTTAESLPMAETLEIHHKLSQLKLETAAAVLNRMSIANFTTSDISRILRPGAGPSPHIAHLAQVASSELRRHRREIRSTGILQRQIGAPVLCLRECPPGQLVDVAAGLAQQISSFTDSWPAGVRPYSPLR